jgi:hypothetical protein
MKPEGGVRAINAAAESDAHQSEGHQESERIVAHVTFYLTSAQSNS